jgi:hypothetical protein
MIIINKRPFFDKNYNFKSIELKNLTHDKKSGRRETWGVNETSFKKNKKQYQELLNLNDEEFEDLLSEFDKITTV